MPSAVLFRAGRILMNDDDGDEMLRVPRWASRVLPGRRVLLLALHDQRQRARPDPLSYYSRLAVYLLTVLIGGFFAWAYLHRFVMWWWFER